MHRCHLLISRYGRNADQNAFLVAQHANSDVPLQGHVLTILTPLVPAHETAGENYALLYDRVQTADGKPQRYGSQGACQAGRWVPDPIENSDAVDKDRAYVGLPSMAKYLLAVSELCRRVRPLLLAGLSPH